MSMWGKIIGGVAGFAVAGPFGAVVGAAIGHAAENSGGAVRGLLPAADPATALRVAAMVGRREDVYALGVVVLAAKVAKCDGPVSRAEIDAFKRVFRVPPEAVRDVGRLFDQARDSGDPPDRYAEQLAASFGDMPHLLEGVLAALFTIARADGEVTPRELATLQTICVRLGLARDAWDRARGATASSGPARGGEDPYAILGVARSADPEELRRAWLRLVRENHPDSLAGRGASADLVARASDRVARVNAAWDRIKRERGL
jgi:DnaJ like chaperone protein